MKGISEKNPACQKEIRFYDIFSLYAKLGTAYKTAL